MYKISLRIVLSNIAVALTLTLSLANAQTLDLWQAVELGQRNDESVQIAQKSVEESRLRTSITRSALLPQLSFGASATHSNTDASRDSNATNFNLTQTIWNAQQRSAHSAAKKNLQLAHISNQRTIATNLADVTSAYLNTLSANANLRLAHANVAAVEAHRSVVDTLFSLGESTILEQTETVADLDLARVRVIDAKNVLDNRRQHLILLIGDNRLDLEPVDDNLDISAERDPPLEEWLSIAREKNYDLRSMRVRLELAKINLKQAKRDFGPTVNLSAIWSDNYSSSIFPGTTYSDRQTRISLNIPLLRSGRGTARLKETYVALERQRLRVTQQAKQLQQQLTNRYQTRQSLRERIAARQALVAANHSQVAAVQNGFERGDRTSNEVLDTQSRLVQSEINLISAIHEYILSGLQLKQSAGILSVADIRDANQRYFH